MIRRSSSSSAHSLFWHEATSRQRSAWHRSDADTAHPRRCRETTSELYHWHDSREMVAYFQILHAALWLAVIAYYFYFGSTKRTTLTSWDSFGAAPRASCSVCRWWLYVWVSFKWRAGSRGGSTSRRTNNPACRSVARVRGSRQLRYAKIYRLRRGERLADVKLPTCHP
jgi:hypothetical protein